MTVRRPTGSPIRAYLLSLLVTAALVGSFADTVAAQGVFRFGHITWQETSPGVVEFTIQNVWRRSAYGDECVNPATELFIACSGAGGLPGVGDIILEAEGSTTFDPGDGSPAIGAPALMYLVTSIDLDANWILGLALDPASLPLVDTTIEHVYADEVVHRAFTESCCRLSALAEDNAHINNPDGTYRVETLVSVGATPVPNESPLAALPPLVVCPIDDVCSFHVPAVDPNGDGLIFRLAIGGEAGGLSGFTQPGPPQAPEAAEIDRTTGLFTWDTTLATLEVGADTLYSAQVVIGSLTAPVSTTIPPPISGTVPTRIPSPRRWRSIS
jgi:hypothetical protein